MQLGLLLLLEARLQVFDLFAHLHQLARAADAAAHQFLFAGAQSRPVRFALAVGLAEAELEGLLLGTYVGERLFGGDHVRIHGEQRLHALDVVAQLSLPLDQSLVSQQELRRFHSRTTRTWPSFTTSPSLTRTSLTMPARGEVTGISIFMDSRMSSSSSSATCAPGCVLTFHTLPTSSALISVMCLQTENC